MNRLKILISVGLLLIGVAAFFLLPRMFVFEPIFVFRLGLGAFIAVITLFAIFGFIIFDLGRWFEQKRSGAELEQAKIDNEKKHVHFIRRLDHEIKNPLTGIQVELANLQEISSEKDKKQAIVNASRALERISHLLSDLRKISELDKDTMEKRLIDIPQLVDEMVAVAASQSKNKDRQINLMVSQVPSPFPKVLGDRDLLGLAIYNVLDNAFKFTSKKDVIEVRVREDGHFIFIEIADTGIGIKDEECDQIFEDLYRGSNAQGIEGSGMGLSLVKKIISIHDGKISVRSQQDQPHATIFTICLPV